MRFALMALWLILCLAMACSSSLATDLISGKWEGEWGPNASERNPVTDDLKYNGKAVTGRFNAGANPVTISSGTFNEKTGELHLEATGKGRGGVDIHYVIDGKLQKNKIAGKWKYENGSGDFEIERH